MSDIASFAREFNDIPAIVGTGFMRLRHGRYLLLQVNQSDKARAWLREIQSSGRVHSLADVRRAEAGPSRQKTPDEAAAAKMGHGETVTLAFSHAGLLELGLSEHVDRPFPSAFRAGMSCASRRQLLGDEPGPNWCWGDSDQGNNFPVHIFVLHFWDGGSAPALEWDSAHLKASGFSVKFIDTCPSYIDEPRRGEPTMHEPFGFRDGIGQPLLRGIALSSAESLAQNRAGCEAFEDRLVSPGEFVLGHCNQYGERTYCPGLARMQGDTMVVDAAFGRNGSYLVVRQIEQHVQVFREFASGSTIGDIAERMMGRRMDGAPLMRSPNAPPERDAFRYLVNDADGFQCPRGAHVRRANPRDALADEVKAGINASKLHRLLRRGRVYAEGCVAAASAQTCDGNDARRAEGCGKGLMFLALNADLDRQFEFVQRSWIAGSRFGDMSDEQDPILGTVRGRTFTVQGHPAGACVGPLPRFTTLRGGGYFFVPGLAALKFISGSLCFRCQK